MEVSENNNKKSLKFMYVQTLLGHLNLILKSTFVCFYFTLELVVKWVQEAKGYVSFARYVSFKIAAVFN